MSRPDLPATERLIDAEIADLPVLKLPVRSVLTALHLAVDSLGSGSRFVGQSVARPETARSVAARTSYLIPLLERCPFEPVGVSANNALAAYREIDPAAKQSLMLLSYGRLCEIMPEAHRRYHAVRKTSDEHYVLEHKTEDFAAFETRDIIVSELALPFGVDIRAKLTDEFDRLVATTSHLKWGPEMNRLCSPLYQAHLRYFSELPLLSDVGFVEATGVSREKFHRFRAALLAIADLCDGIAAALSRQMEARPEDEREDAATEILEWISVFWSDDAFVTIASDFAELSIEEWEKLASFFTVDFRPGARSTSHAKEGFCPPLTRLSGGWLFNPFALKMFLTERNLLVCLNWLDRTRFDNVVSCHMEPQLIDDAVDVLRTFPKLTLLKNVEWDKGVEGEIDLLVYDPQENAALHVQAKASLPPEGARMVQATEARVAEGLDQLTRFRGLSSSDVDAVISKAVGKPVADVFIIDVLLARACFGTERAWSRAGNVCLTTLPLLQSLVYQLTRDNRSFSVKDFSQQTTVMIDQLVEDSAPTWKSETLQFENATIVVPSLEFDRGAVSRARINGRVVAERCALRTS